MNNSMNISEEGIALIKKFEGCELKAYLCPSGVWTIGYGRTKKVKEGDTCTQEQADEWLKEEMPEYEGYINHFVDAQLNQSQFDALCSWVYNLGPTNLKSSTLLTVLNQERFDDVPREIKRWNKSAGQVLQGLVNRREAEALLFEGKKWY
tara:strand:+ start:1033 stop:1482 length:450 start_codon:yes stop_codon:yes gene_type:complete